MKLIGFSGGFYEDNFSTYLKQDENQSGEEPLEESQRTSQLLVEEETFGAQLAIATQVLREMRSMEENLNTSPTVINGWVEMVVNSASSLPL